MIDNNNTIHNIYKCTQIHFERFEFLINNSFANDNLMTSIKEMSFINCMRMKILDLIKSVDKII